MNECSVSSCTNPRQRREWCNAHYQRWLKHGNPEAGQRLRKKRDKPCLVSECGRPVLSVGLCSRHYQRQKRGQPLSGGTLRPAQTTLPCTVDGCDRMCRARGWCDPHYKAWLKTGDPLVRPPRKKRPTGNGKGWLTDQGYRLLHLPDHPNAKSDGRIAEHTVVMAEKIGRPLRPGENVHHKNGHRADNRPENLELWRKVQPTGQRVADLVRYANEITALYGTDPAPFD